MNVVLAQKTGFCFGVKRAVAMAEAALKGKGPIYSLGSIIHNKQVVDDLAAKGLKVIKDIKGIKTGTVIISSHGLSPRIMADILKYGIRIIDTTCPFVLNAQTIAGRLSKEGYAVVIVGDAHHPEVKALVDYAPGRTYVVKNKSQAAALRPRFRPADKISVISQTTQSMNNFLEVVNAISNFRPKEMRVFNTICQDAQTRQAHARQLSGKVDVMMVIGGQDSANTRRLFEVCRKISDDCHLVETEKDLAEAWFRPDQVVGVTSGASTPDWVIKKVVNRINSKFPTRAGKRKGLCN